MATYKQMENMKLDEDTDDTEDDSTSDEEETTIDKENDFVEEKKSYIEDRSSVGDSAQHDLTLVFEEHKFYVSRFVLCLASPVFQAMFQSDFQEKNLQEVKLQGKKYEDIAEFLRCIYPNKLKLITETNVYQVLPLVVEYQIKVLQERCETVLTEVVQKKQEVVIKHLELAELYDMQDLRKMCIYIASEPQRCMEFSTSKISAKALLQIHFLNFERSQLNCQDDQDLFRGGRVENTVIKEDMKNRYSITISVSSNTIILQYLEQCRNTYQWMRLSHRYMPKLLDQQKDGLQCTSYGEELSLLPESVKQLLNIPEDKRQYLYPPLPDVREPRDQ